jgi:hypothetical protein
MSGQRPPSARSLAPRGHKAGFTQAEEEVDIVRKPSPVRSLPPPRLNWSAWAMILVILFVVIGLLFSVTGV